MVMVYHFLLEFISLPIKACYLFITDVINIKSITSKYTNSSFKCLFHKALVNTAVVTGLRHTVFTIVTIVKQATDIQIQSCSLHM